MRANEDRRLPPAATVMGPALAVPLWGAGVPSPVRVARGVAGTVADAEGGPRRLARRPRAIPGTQPIRGLERSSETWLLRAEAMEVERLR